MSETGALQHALESCPTFERWDDDGPWETVVILEMARNFGVSSRDVVAKLDRLLKGEGSNDSVGAFFEKLTDDEKIAIRDAVDEIAHARLEGVRIEKQQGRNFTYRATKDDVRFTFNYRPDDARGDRPAGAPHGFMVDVVARRK